MSDDGQAAGVYALESAYLDRFVQVGYASGRVLSVSFPATPDEHGTEHPLLDRIEAYLEGQRKTFEDVDVALSAAVPTEQRDVLVEVREIPYGQQVSVERLARTTPGLDPDDADDLQLVRTALAENPAPLVVPDHRIRDGPSAAPPEIEQRLRSLEGL
ncbi:MAG: MGMT family protein [Haloarculaceae archaeon]